MDASEEFHDPVRFVEARTKAMPGGAAAQADELPGTLYHYTSGQGLFGILTSGELHCTHILYMNDSSELDYGRAVVRRLVEEAAPRVAGEVRAFCGELLRALDAPDFEYYVCCFCAKPDLLSQWRAYGAQAAGYSIGFDAEDMRGVLPEYSGLARVIYDPEEQDRAVRRMLIAYLETAQDCCTAYGGHQRLKEAMSRWAAIAANGLGRLMVRMKSGAFAEEHEWRAIIIRFSFDTAVVRFRLAANGVVVPYHAWRFKRDGIKAVRQVRHGPTVNAALAVRSLGMFLHNLGYRDVGVRGSAIPLRG